jgi:hypothetical protein
MTTKTITISDAVRSINFLATNFMETKELDKEALEVSVRAISENLLVRDYFLGMPQDFGLTFMISLSKKMVDAVEELELHPVNLYAVYSAFLYESGEKELSIHNINKALEIDSEHSLTKLLVRVYESNFWASKDFFEMRNDLHSKVIAQTKENANTEI